jgi:IS30 family transposase
MRHNDCNTKKDYRHLTEAERYKIEGLLEAKKKPIEIAEILGRDTSTIYREIERGGVWRLQYNLTERKQYRANVGQAEHEKRIKNRERPLKIGKDKRLEAYIRIKLKENRYSPDVIIGEIKANGLEFEGMICTRTLYDYIERGIFSGISNKDLWEKSKKKRRRYKPVVRVSRNNRVSRSIEERPKAVDDRYEYGHWEGDTVKGPQGSIASILTLTERKSREEIMIRLGSAAQEAIKEAFDGLEREYGPSFREKFKSVTFDNGVEFLDWRTLEVSILDGKRRTTIYFAHAYSAWERGTNENLNRMVRRFIPKGTPIALVSEEEIKNTQDWMNNYPRSHFKTSSM